ncbi:MAG: 2Fe-2S iron-sulfur cluster-binding protein [Pseudomonadota bacterium]
MTSFRADYGGLIDRSRELKFSFDGKPYQGFAGDTLASALLANGVRVVGRSFKYHRPRGVWSAWVDEPNAIMAVTLNGRELPNCLATTTMLEDGMQVRSVNAWPSAAFDLKGGLDIFHRWLCAGFYYKTFIWPNWHMFEPAIRKMAGLGSVSTDVIDDYVSDQIHEHCDVLVVGAGAAGLVAARTAAEAGHKVVLADDHHAPGGSLYQVDRVEGRAPQDWIDEQVTALQAAGGRLLCSSTAFGVYDHGLVGLIECGHFATAPRLWRLRCARVVLATGALDRPMTFADNDKPGVMSLFGAAELLARYGVVPGREIALISNHSLFKNAVQQLESAGAKVRVLEASTTALQARGRKVLSGVSVDGQHYQADALLVSAGLTPLVHLWCHAGGKLQWCEQRQTFLPGAPPAQMTAIGAANGTFDLAAALDEARAAGSGQSASRSDAAVQFTPHWPAPNSTGRQWIDFQHDVTLKDIELAARENYVSVEHLKRYTTLGMAADQGKTSNMAGLAAMATIQGVDIPHVGTTAFRPPFVPVPLEAYHGHHTKSHYHPVKRLVLEPQHRAANAALCEYGGWLRPGWYGSGERDAIIQVEAKMARDSAGILDASPLGKIEVMGPDAEDFVNFVYYNSVGNLKPGHIRYGFMLSESGFVFDDGVISRVDQHKFVISCSSSHVDSVRNHLESWRQDGNDPARIFVHDMTQQWATVTVTGPKAREILASLDLGIDLAADAFPHMTFREADYQASSVRVARVSFTGDTSFEVSIRASRAPLLWNTLLAAAAPLGGGPIGIEALSILRTEKGYIMVGKDMDGETMPHDLGFGGPREKKNTAFVGDRSLHGAMANERDRKTLVGLTVADGAPPLPIGAHAISETSSPRSIGYVTSSYQSPNLGRPVALGLIENGHDRIGESIHIRHREQFRSATIAPVCAFDPQGARLNA